jgi:hypothetical protein
MNIKELAEQAGFKSIHGYDEEFERFAELIRADEREACAKLCEENMFFATGEQHAKAIRQRGEKYWAKIISGVNVAQIISSALHQTIKGELRQRFVEMVTKDIEPMFEEYTRQIVMQVYEMKDPCSMDGLKINVTFKLPEVRNETT